jgi:N-acetylglucosamine kinase-like BadF-type ATPase
MAYLGLDAGGTQSRHAWRPAGAGSSGSGPGVQPAVHGEAAATVALADALRVAAPAPAQVQQCVAALAGAGDRSVAERIAAALPGHGVSFPVLVVGDVLAAAAGTLADGPGVLVWSGTGSFAVARSPGGRLVRVGGRGHLLGDQGSGYDFVRRAAAAVLLAEDGLGPATALREPLTQAFAAPAPRRLGAVLQQLDPGRVAAALPVVLAVAAGGDVVANAVLAEGVAALAALAIAAATRAELAWGGGSLTLGGGVLTAAADLRHALAGNLARLGAAAPRVAAADAGATGAARLAEAVHRRQDPFWQWITDAL